jgi:large conductance mechanosensitive channel
MLKGFKEFIMRGNVVDLSVCIVIGAAFTALFGAFTNAFIKPLIQLLSGGQGVTAGAFRVRGIPFDWASFVNACITFLITAAALYFLVVFPLNKLAERRARGEEPPPTAPSEEVKLLTEIRDALVSGRAMPGATSDVAHRERQQGEPPRHS